MGGAGSPLGLDTGRLKPDRNLCAVMDMFAPGAARLLGGVDPVAVALKPEVVRRQRVFGSDLNDARILAGRSGDMAVVLVHFHLLFHSKDS